MHRKRIRQHKKGPNQKKIQNMPLTSEDAVKPQAPPTLCSTNRRHHHRGTRTHPTACAQTLLEAMGSKSQRTVAVDQGLQ
jgi:hypothetical protein